MIATFINAGLVLLGSAIGLLFRTGSASASPPW